MKVRVKILKCEALELGEEGGFSQLCLPTGLHKLHLPDAAFALTLGGFTWGGLSEPSSLARLALPFTCCVTPGQEAPPL